MTKAHNDRIIQDGEDKGYSIRMGKTVPVNSANLAYVYSEPISPDNNIEINDMSKFIPENKISEEEKEIKILYPNEDFLLRELDSDGSLSSKDFLLADEFSYKSSRQDECFPLFYKTTLKGDFSPKNSLVSPFFSGYSEEVPEAIPFAKISNSDKNNLLYLGNKITITRKDGQPLEPTDRYKIQLEKVNGTQEIRYRVHIFTNFKCSKDITYLIEYQKMLDTGATQYNVIEVLNATTYFDEIDKFFIDELVSKQNEWADEFNLKSYAVVESEDHGYNVYAPSQMVVANNITRPAHQFKYRVIGDMKTKISEMNPGTLNVGIVYTNNAGPTYQNLTAVLKKINEDSLKPNYLTFKNPHPKLYSYTENNPNYWTIDLKMPAEDLDDYDLIIISGYGFKDMSMYNDNLRSYLSNGGRVWVDNSGNGLDVLSFTKPDGTETFLSNIHFSKTENVNGYRGLSDSEMALDMTNRLYNVSKGNENVYFGYNTEQEVVGPKMEFGTNEFEGEWTSIAETNTKDILIMKRDSFENGELIYSNIGLLRSLYTGVEVNTKLILNMLLYMAERKFMVGPWKQEYIHHRKNLFKEEYKDYNGNVVYMDSKSDIDDSVIVAKKIISPSLKNALIPYISKEFQKGNGVYRVETQTDNQINLTNESFEEENSDGKTSWTTSTQQALIGWNTYHVSGSTPVFKHENSFSIRGTKSISIETGMDALGSNAYWTAENITLNKGLYKINTFIKLVNVSKTSGEGFQFALLNQNNEILFKGEGYTGSADWFEIEEVFEIKETDTYKFAFGFINGNSNGKVYMDMVSLFNTGAVLMTPENEGQLPLYAYATTPKGEIFNVESQGFNPSQITVYDPELTFTYSIKSYVYRWSDEFNKYVQTPGNFVTGRFNIKRSDGIKNIGDIIQSLLPASLEGNEWSDKNNIYYQIELGNANVVSDDTKFVNLQVYDADKGVYHYSKDGRIVVRYRDIYYGKGDNANIYLQAYTDYYTVRAIKRRYGLEMQNNKEVYLELPKTIDSKESWHVNVHNGSFYKDELNYSDLLQLSQNENALDKYLNRIFGKHYYAFPEYSRQAFSPSLGYGERSEELLEYLDDSTLKTQKYPIHYLNGSVQKEEMKKVSENGLIFKADKNKWLKTELVVVYNDKNNDGILTPYTSGFDIDYSNGTVMFHPELGRTPNLISNTDLLKSTVIEDVINWDEDLNKLTELADGWESSSDYKVNSSDNKKGNHAYVNYMRFDEPVIDLSSINNSLGLQRTLRMKHVLSKPLELSEKYTLTYEVFSSVANQKLKTGIGTQSKSNNLIKTSSKNYEKFTVGPTFSQYKDAFFEVDGVNIKSGDTITFRAKVKTSAGKEGAVRINCIRRSDDVIVGNTAASANRVTTEGYTYITYTIPSSIKSVSFGFNNGTASTTNTAYDIEVSEVKAEIGSTFTSFDYPEPEYKGTENDYLITEKDKWMKVSREITLTEEFLETPSIFVEASGQLDSELYVRKIMLNKGEEPLRWLPSLEDMNGSAIPEGKVFIDYSYNNLEVYERTYNNKQIKEEQLWTLDSKTFYSNNQSWLKFPNPIIYASNYGSRDLEVANINSYSIDYKTGTITFKEETPLKIYASYFYSTDKLIDLTDVDVENGLIIVKDKVDFRKEYYVNYAYKEDFIEYKGYYDERVKRFIKLDLNPLEGHYSTIATVKKDNLGNEMTVYQEVGSSQLINKEIYLYMLPYKNSFGQYEPNTIRHCFSEEEWVVLQNSTPTALLLGIIVVRENTSKEDIVVMDARKLGGGIREDISYNEIKKRDPDATTFWDIGSFDGEAYYKNGVIVFEIPRKVLKENGGKFTTDDIQEMLKKYVAYGIYSIIEYID